MISHSRGLCVWFLLAAACALPTAPRAAEEEEDEQAVPAREIAPALLKHCVRVRVYTKKDDGEDPSVGSLAQDLHNERPSYFGGYLWDATTVLMADMVLHERFLRRIEVEAGGKTVEATLKGYLLKQDAMLLTLAEPLPEVQPIAFAPAPDPKDWGKLRAVGYGWNQGRWTIGISGAAMGYTLTDDGTSFLFGRYSGLLVDAKGRVVGASFSGSMSVEGDEYPWLREKLEAAPFLDLTSKHEKLDALRQRLRQAALEVKFSFRAEVEEDENRAWNNRRFRQGDENEAELVAAGFLIQPQRLLVPAVLERDMVARLESVEVQLIAADGQPAGTRPARFAGALKDFHAVLVDIEGDPLPGPLALRPEAAFRPGELFLKANIDYRHKKRKERMAYDRYRGLFRTYMDMPGVWTFTDEGDGSIAFSLDGEIIGLSLAHRPKPTGDEYGYRGDNNSMFRPIRLVVETLARADAIDETIRPLEKEQEKRLVTLGVEWQNLDVNLAKTFQAEKETRGGEIGLLVLYVYPDSPAAQVGLQVEDILLRVKDPERAEPIELRASFGGDRYGFMPNFDELPDEARASFMNRMPPPWPDRTNVLTELLTEIGEGKHVSIEYLRKGKKQSVAFDTQKGRPDFRAAAKYKSEKLGLTVKSLTYEVKRFFQRTDDAGVIVSRIEPGAKASVARIANYQLITQVNKQPVESLEDFKAKIRPLEEGETNTIEFTVWYMGRTRMVKIELAAAAPQPEE